MRRSARDTIGIDWKHAGQLEFCVTALEGKELQTLASEPTGDPSEYFVTNDQFPPLDAWVLDGILRNLRPQRMIESGSGFSSLVAARTNREALDGSMKLTCVEPYPREFLMAGVPGVSELRAEKVQETPLELFTALQAGDTSHTVKTGGDVVWIFQEIIPRLAAGVYVHIHDVFLPGDYPKDWVMSGWGWTRPIWSPPSWPSTRSSKSSGALSTCSSVTRTACWRRFPA